jgi:NTE family protein
MLIGIRGISITLSGPIRVTAAPGVTLPRVSDPADREPIAVVLAGGGARGAYEIGVLAELLPTLARRGERVDIVVGTSVGALNAAYLDANAHRSPDEVVDSAIDIWTTMGYDDVLEPLLSLGAVPRLLPIVAQLAGVPGGRALALLDPTPLTATLERVVDFSQLKRNVSKGSISIAAVVATSGLTSRSVVFHHGASLGVGGASPPADRKRGIDYVAAALGTDHVRASAAIPGVFPAVHVERPTVARGWYFDGGTRLNTPIKPAISLGARKVVVIGLNSIAAGPPALASRKRPDLYAGAAQLLQAVLVDPLVNDVRTLAKVNTLVRRRPDEAGDDRALPYIFVAPEEREAIGERAVKMFRDHYHGWRGIRRSKDIALIGRLVNGTASPLHGELLSYLFFAPEFARALIELGRQDALRWLAAEHDDGPWRTRPLPGEEPVAQEPPRRRSAQMR